MGHLVGDRRPGINDLVVPLAIRDQPLGVLVLNLLDVCLGGIEEGLFFFGNDHVLNAD